MMRIFLFFVIIALSNGIKSNSLKLEQVLILSRHNIRTPLVANLQAYSSRIWPKFNEPVADLTKKGALLESFMAEYITEWLKSEDFINECPKSEEILIYSNTRPRTRDTAKAFAKGVFHSCDIPFHHTDNTDIFDPLFFPVFHNNSEHFKQSVNEEMKMKIHEQDLKQSYLELNRILDIQNSDICKQNSICDLSVLNDEVVYEEGEEPDVNGPLTIGTNIVDNFLMSFYEGFPFKDVAWGEITTDEQWELLAKILKQNLNVRFNTTGSKDMARPLLGFMFDIFRSGAPKFTVLVGHDSNLSPVISALGFKAFKLRNQYEPNPIGGKLVFQKWSNSENSYLKIEYLYQSFSQLRNGVILSLAQPPERVLLELKDCKTDDQGFCPWNDFINFNF